MVLEYSLINIYVYVSTTVLYKSTTGFVTKVVSHRVLTCMRIQIWSTYRPFASEYDIQIRLNSDTGNRTPVSRVTGGDTSHYTMSERCHYIERVKIRQAPTTPIHTIPS